jgi:hypothetical protein
VFFGRIGNCLVMSLSVIFFFLCVTVSYLKPINIPIQIFVKGKMGSLIVPRIRAQVFLDNLNITDG